MINPALLLVIFVFLSSVCYAVLRIWTAVNGKKVAAEFVSSEQGIIKLKLRSGKLFNITKEKLSPEDNKFISSQTKPKGVMHDKSLPFAKDVKISSGNGDLSSVVSKRNSENILLRQLNALNPGYNEINVDYGGSLRRLIITVPSTFDDKSQHPVLFCFHGAGGKADGQSKRWSRHVKSRGLIVISVEAVQPLAKWNFRDGFHTEDHDDVGFILKIVDALIANEAIDSKSVYATGHSSGGLFCYRLAKETDVFAALSPMSCGMIKGAHDPSAGTKAVPIIQVIGDKDKSYNGSSNPKVTMYSATKRIDIWRKFNQCNNQPKVIEKGKEIEVHTYFGPSGIEVALCKVKEQGHFLRKDLRDMADSLALDFLLKHKNKQYLNLKRTNNKSDGKAKK